jgi:hypothetical protein
VLAAAPLGALGTGAPRAPSRRAACALPESRAGFRAALAPRPTPGLLVFPGAAGWDDSIEPFVRNGGLVIFESGAAFADARAFAEQRAGLRSAFALTIEDPVPLWRDGRRPAYLDLAWPAPARIRDFSYAVTVRGGEAIGNIDGAPVAAVQRSGRGVLLFLGSPIGPALGHDPDSRAWLASVLDHPPTSAASSRSAAGAAAAATPAAHRATTTAVNTSIV